MLNEEYFIDFHLTLISVKTLFQAGNLALKKQQLIGMKNGISLKMKVTRLLLIWIFLNIYDRAE